LDFARKAMQRPQMESERERTMSFRVLENR
jgi:hypothetical protein